LATTSQRSVLEQMELFDAFNANIYVPNVTSLQSIDIVLEVTKKNDVAEQRGVS
jgi:vesicle-fusing ATPase